MHRGQVAMTGTPREVFAHPMELEKMGLAAPQVSYVFAQLKAKGYDVPTDVYTVEEAKEALLKLVKQVKA
jgi:energy-coupling factor transport system ATP-binding protein